MSAHERNYINLLVLKLMLPEHARLEQSEENHLGKKGIAL